jgi:hypothetical protein
LISPSFHVSSSGTVALTETEGSNPTPAPIRIVRPSARGRLSGQTKVATASAPAATAAIRWIDIACSVRVRPITMNADAENTSSETRNPPQKNRIRPIATRMAAIPTAAPLSKD